MTSQITVRARDCRGRDTRFPSVGEALTYQGREWTVVGLFVGADPSTSELEEYLVLEGEPEEEGVAGT